jgi:hypothetical protein
MSAPRVKSPPRPFFYLSFFLSFFLFDRAAGFLPPRPRIVAGRRAQMLSRLAALQRPHAPGAPAFTAIEHDGRLMSRVDYAPVYFTPSSCQRALFRWRMFFGRPCYEVHGACDVRINLYPAAPFRLAKVLFAWTIVQAGWDSSF